MKKLKTCQLDFIFNRTYDKNTHILQYLCPCGKAGMDILVDVTSTENGDCMNDICNIDKKAIKGIIDFCSSYCHM